MRISDWSSDVCSSDLAGSRVDRFRRDATTGERTMRKMQIAAVLAIVSCLGGCATYQVGSADAAAQLKRFDPLPEKGSVYVCRESALLVARGVKTEVYVDNENIGTRSEEHTSELQSLMRISYAVF